MARKAAPSKEIYTTAVVNKDPKSLAASYLYDVSRTAEGLFTAVVREIDGLTVSLPSPIDALTQLKKDVVARLQGLEEAERPVPLGIQNKEAIDRAKEVPKHIRKAYGREMREAEH